MKKRNSSIELLRIIAMLMIISLHFWGHCVNVSELPHFSLLWYVGWFLRGLSYTGVNVYVLISSYYLCESSFKFKRLLLLVIEVWLYSVLIYLLYLPSIGFSIGTFIISLLPILFGEYWFVTIYVGLYILSPFLNMGLSAFDKNSLRRLIVVLFVLFSLIPNIFFYSKWLNYGGGYGIVWFSVLYIIGTYIRRYCSSEYLIEHKTSIRCYTLIFIILPFLSKVAITWLTTLVTGHSIASGAFFLNNSVLVFPASVFLFLTFLTISIPCSKIINYIGSSTFAVYLIHDNPYVRNSMWPWLYNKLDVLSINLIWQFFIVLFLIFVISIIIDSIRRGVFYPLNNEIWKKKSL